MPTAGGLMPVEKCTAIGMIQEAICTASTPIYVANYIAEIPTEPAMNCRISKIKFLR